MVMGNKKYAAGGTVDVTITPASGSFGAAAPPPTIGANSPVPPPTGVTPPPVATGAAAMSPVPPPPAGGNPGGLPPATPTAQPPTGGVPLSNSVANVPVGGTSGPMNSPYATSVNGMGMPASMPNSSVVASPGPNGIMPGVSGSSVAIPNPLSSVLARGGTAKPTKLAGGGIPTSEALDPWYTRAEFRGMLQPEGLVKSTGAGRTDVHSINVPAGSYVVPADVTSGLGEGNTLAGASVMDRMMHSNPYGIQVSKGARGSGPPRAPAAYKEEPALPASVTGPLEARGGNIKSQQQQGHPDMVPIIVAGGEMIYYPHTIKSKFGDLNAGHKTLDKFVLNARAKTIKDMQKLKGPKGASK